MQKIMFNDKYGLTDAVLEGRKTQTRRVLNPTMLFKRLKTYEGWSKEDISAWKRSCKTRLYESQGAELQQMLDYALSSSRYKVGETVAIAQSYKDIHAEILREIGDLELKKEFLQFKGYTNKMFVRAEKMPHSIRITNIRIERLQDISNEDCLKEGIYETKFLKAGIAPIRGCGPLGTINHHPLLGYGSFCLYMSVKEAYAALIDRISGKGTWVSNPYVFVYDFELID